MSHVRPMESYTVCTEEILGYPKRWGILVTKAIANLPYLRTACALGLCITYVMKMKGLQCNWFYGIYPICDRPLKAIAITAPNNPNPNDAPHQLLNLINGAHLFIFTTTFTYLSLLSYHKTDIFFTSFLYNISLWDDQVEKFKAHHGGCSTKICVGYPVPGEENAGHH